MKTPRILLLMAFTILGIVSFFLPCKSYYPWFIFTSDHVVYEKVADEFNRCAIVAQLCYCVALAPALAFAILQTKLERNLIGLLTISLVLPVMLFFAQFSLAFGLFEARIKMLSGYFLFMTLSGIGCVIFWMMTLREIWRRIRCRRQRLKAV
jgi:hypothetical protein